LKKSTHHSNIVRSSGNKTLDKQKSKKKSLKRL
jgi:hypothetical protein